MIHFLIEERNLKAKKPKGKKIAQVRNKHLNVQWWHYIVPVCML